jgi:MoaA/NifB/PqqE/SkfB family radical SAM enzyme
MNLALDTAVVGSEVTPHPLQFSEVRIENTNRCGYKCFFCPREEQTREQGLMPVEDLALIIDRIGEHSGLVDLHGFGEPLLDKSLPVKIALVNTRWPEAEPRFYSTLGVKVPPDYFSELVEAGLRHVEVSFYGFDEESYEQAHGRALYAIARENLIQLCNAQKASGGRLQVVVRAFPKHDEIKQPGVNPQRVLEFHDWLNGLGVNIVRERELHNYGGGRRYNAAGEELPCSVVWGFRRRVLQITWNLDVIPCCFDFNAEVKLGNLRSQSVEEIFLGRPYTEFIQSHIDNRLDNYPICKACERCYRA